MKMLMDDQTKDILATLKKNSSILRDLLGKLEGNVIVNKNKLLEAGFRFKYITDTSNTKNGTLVCYCYGYAYFSLENDQYLIMRREDVPA